MIQYLGTALCFISIIIKYSNGQDVSCPSLVNLNGLAGEDLYENLLRVFANSTYNAAAQSGWALCVTAVPGQTFWSLGQLTSVGIDAIGLTSGTKNISDPQDCVAFASSINNTLGNFISLYIANASVPDSDGGCGIRQIGELLFRIKAIGSTNQTALYQGQYFGKLLRLGNGMSGLDTVAARNDTARCKSVLSGFSTGWVDSLRLDHTDQEIKKAFTVPCRPQG